MRASSAVVPLVLFFRTRRKDVLKSVFTRKVQTCIPRSQPLMLRDTAVENSLFSSDTLQQGLQNRVPHPDIQIFIF